MNLLNETLKILASWDKDPGDVEFVRNSKSWFTFSQFAEHADFEYNEGYGGNEIDSALYVVGKDWWLERGEYDGSEWWEFKRLPTRFNLLHQQTIQQSDLTER